jgi:hypothetical protein
MKFQEIDFHVELFKAYLEPHDARLAYLGLLRKKSGWQKDAFLVKLETALKNIKNAFETYNSNRQNLFNGEVTDISIPIILFNRFPQLDNFSKSFPNKKLDQNIIKDLENIILIYKLDSRMKRLKKIFNESEKSNSKDGQEVQNKNHPLESIWMKNPKVSLDDFLSKGYDLKLWDEH